MTNGSVCRVAVALASVVCTAVGFARADMPPLEELLSAAMKHSPAVVAAEAEKAVAEAKLSTARMEVARQVIAMRGEWELAKAVSDKAGAELDMAEKKVSKGLAPADEAQKHRLAIVDARAKMARIESEMPFLTGRSAALGASAEANIFSPPQRSQPSVQPDQLDTAAYKPLESLAKKVGEVKFVEVAIKDAVDSVTKLSGVPVTLDRNSADESVKVSLELKDAPLSAVLHAIEDQCGGPVFVVRDYGILLTTREFATERGYPTVSEFLARAKAAKTAPASQPARP